MDLSPEDKQRIYDEEQRRIAEEKYRAAVRETLAGAKTPPPTLTVKRRIGSTPFIVVLLVLVLFCALWGIAESQARSNRNAGGAGLGVPAIFWQPVAKNINETLSVGALSYRIYQLEVDGETMRNYHIAGHFNASGGVGNDINVVLCTDDEFANWINNHPARAFYTSQGERTTGSFDVHLPAGSYTLAFSNRGSPMFARQVSVTAKITYEQKPRS